MLGKIHMSIFWRIPRLIKLILLEKFMTILVDKGQDVRDVNVVDLKEVLNSDFLGICTDGKGS
jgi:hypothetical protein